MMLISWHTATVTQDLAKPMEKPPMCGGNLGQVRLCVHSLYLILGFQMPMLARVAELTKILLM